MTLDQIKTWLNEAARYFESLAPGGEDRAYWSNVANAETARRVEAALVALEAERDMLRTALRPFAENAAVIRADHEDDLSPEWAPFNCIDDYRRARAAMGEQ